MLYSLIVFVRFICTFFSCPHLLILLVRSLELTDVSVQIKQKLTHQSLWGRCSSQQQKEQLECRQEEDLHLHAGMF